MRAACSSGVRTSGVLGARDSSVSEGAVRTGAEALGADGIPPFHGAGGRDRGAVTRLAGSDNTLGDGVAGGRHGLGAAVTGRPRTGDKVTGLDHTLVDRSELGIIETVADLLADSGDGALHVGLVGKLGRRDGILHPLKQLLVGDEPDIGEGTGIGKEFVVELSGIAYMDRVEVDTEGRAVSVVVAVKVLSKPGGDNLSRSIQLYIHGVGNSSWQVAVHDCCHGNLPHTGNRDGLIADTVPAVVGQAVVESVGPVSVGGDGIGRRVIQELFLTKNSKGTIGVVQERCTESIQLSKGNTREGVNGPTVASDFGCNYRWERCVQRKEDTLFS